MGEQQYRVGGGYTAFVYAGRPLIFIEIIRDTAPQPVAPPEPIQPLDARHPIEIAFANAHGVGTLELTLREKWFADVWEQLPGYAGATDIVEVFQRNIDRGSVTCAKIIRGPRGIRRGVYYHGCVVTRIDDSETVQITTLTLPKTITLTYTHKTRV